MHNVALNHRRQFGRIVPLDPSGNEAALSSVGFYYLPPRLRGVEFSLLAGNLWDSRFQEVPAVPAARRQFSAGAAWRW